MIKQFTFPTGLTPLRLAIAFIYVTHAVTRIRNGPEGFGEFLASS